MKKWNELPYWMRGSLIFGSVIVISNYLGVVFYNLGILSYIFMHIYFFLSIPIILVLGMVGIINIKGYQYFPKESYIPSTPKAVLITLVAWILIGALIGWMHGKKKELREKRLSAQKVGVIK